MWTTGSALIRIKTDKVVTVSSGVYICNQAEEFLLSVCPQIIALAAEHPEAELSASLPTSVTQATIVWDSIVLNQALDLPRTQSFIDPLKTAFKWIPSGSPQVALFEFSSRHDAHDRRKAATIPFNIESSYSKLLHQQVRIVSSPFAGVNPALFMGYQSQGIVSYVVRSEPCPCILVDTRFLENMEGAQVLLEESMLSVGVVAGCLKKENGEGSLTCVVLWNEIIDAVFKANSDKLDAVRHCFGSRASSPVQAAAPQFHGVVVVESVMRGNRKAWGSGVLLADDLVVTNKHVAGRNFLYLNVWFEHKDRVRVHAVAEPLIGVDLIFLKLSRPVSYRPVSLSPDVPSPKDFVASRGFGLFYPERLSPILQPLYSEGIVASRHVSQVFAGTKPEPSMLICSAGCWNGSSGGGIFNRSGELVGLMTSNARDDVNDEILPDMAFVIPVNIVRTGLSCLKEGRRLETTNGFHKLWNLESTHVDTRRPARPLL